MNKFLLFIVLFISLTILVSAAKVPPTNPCPIQADTNVVFYGETGFGGVGDLSRSWITHFFDWWKQQDPSIKYVILDSGDVKYDCNLNNYPNVKVYVQPGGNAYYQQKKLGTAGKTNINSYIDSGRGYVGICAGFFYAAGDYYWQGQYYNRPDLLGKFPTVEGSITDIADYDQNPGYALTSVSNGNSMIYYGGPTRGWRQTSSTFPGQALLSFTNIPGDLPASIESDNMLLMTAHAEAYENDGIQGLTTDQRVNNYIWFANSINSVAGTNFNVPLPPTYECSDGLDNDGDTFVDYPNDPGCSSANDLNEIDSISGEIFFDDFETGTLNGWTTTSASGASKWIASTASPFQGTYSVYSKPTSTTNPASVLEKQVDTSGYSNLKFSYYRKLVGLDSADEFQAEWYDGTSWAIIEQTGSNSANDAGYIYKEFILPLSAGNNPGFKIKFECTAGAVSEYCLVDNVKVFA